MAFFYARRSRKKGLNFAKFHARGGRGLQRAHPEVGIPLPPAHPRRGRGGTAGGAGCATAGSTRRRARATGRGATYDGAARRAATPNAAATGRTLGAATGRGRIPGRRATGANRLLSGANAAYFRATTGAGRYRRRGRLPVPGRGVYRGAATPAGGAAAQPTPGGAATRRLHPPAKITVFRRLVTGSRRTRSLCAFPGGYPGAATRRRGAKKYFFRGAGFCAGIPASRILRAYIEAGRPGGATGILIRQKPPEKLVLFGTCFFRRPE